MVRRDKREPRCRNSWRPSDGPPVPRMEDVRRQSPETYVAIQRSPPMQPPPSPCMTSEYIEHTTPVIGHATPEGPIHPFKNPNLIPVVPRRSQLSASSSLAAKFQHNQDQDQERLPQIWHPSVDDLIRRTAHDYDLVMNYERDAEGGQRWLPEDVALIRKAGKMLHRDIFALKHMQQLVAKYGDRDKDMMMRIKRAANLLKLECERVQRAINKYEQKCEFELLRDGAYAQDEDGNFYRPTTPEPDAAEDEDLQSLQTSIECGEIRSPEDTYNASQKHYEESRHHPSTFQTPPDNRTDSRAEHTGPFNSAFRKTSSLDTAKFCYARQRFEAAHPPSARRSQRVLEGRISKSSQATPSARERHVPSPARHIGTVDSNPGASQEMSDKKLYKRGRNNIYERDGRSRRQAKKDREQVRSPRPTAGRLGKHVLHY